MVLLPDFMLFLFYLQFNQLEHRHCGQISSEKEWKPRGVRGCVDILSAAHPTEEEPLPSEVEILTNLGHIGEQE
jgi:hypothetical protein